MAAHWGCTTAGITGDARRSHEELRVDALLDPGARRALFTLTILEIVLGIDNVVFIAMAANTLPEEKRERAM